MTSLHQIKNRLGKELSQLYEAFCSAQELLEEGNLPDPAAAGCNGTARLAPLGLPEPADRGLAKHRSGQWIGHAG